MSDIRDGVQAEVSGTVGRQGDGRFTVEVMTERAKYPDYVTVWRADFPVTEGDRVTVRGVMSWRKSERNGKTYVDVSVNQPVIVAQDHVTASVAGQNAEPVYSPPQDVVSAQWASGAFEHEDGAPF